MKIAKTNAIRYLDKNKVEYSCHVYAAEAALSATQVAEAIREPADKIFKTLVTVGKSGKNYVFVIPGNGELNLKKAAETVNEKSISMLPQRDLLKLTGYIHGGCSPFAMKTVFPTVLDESAVNLPTIIISAGKIGLQMELAPQVLVELLSAQFAKVIN